MPKHISLPISHSPLFGLLVIYVASPPSTSIIDLPTDLHKKNPFNARLHGW
jgi:hypothetical protein